MTYTWQDLAVPMRALPTQVKVWGMECGGICANPLLLKETEFNMHNQIDGVNTLEEREASYISQSLGPWTKSGTK